MVNYIFTAGIDPGALSLPPEYQNWLEQWLRDQEQALEDGDVASSLCFQAALCELVLFGGLRTDWDGVLQRYLTAEGGRPLAYSERFGKRLFGFADQWKQTPVHALYTKYWFDTLLGNVQGSIASLARLVESFVQPDGWIYNSRESETRIRTRMKSEYFMSMAMGVEILQAAGRLDGSARSLMATLAAAPNSGFLSAEYFRSLALGTLGALHQMPVGIDGTIADCRAGQGYCDFSIKNKVDDYMGTAKRTGRDFAQHSALSTYHALHLSQFTPAAEQASIHGQVGLFATLLVADPFDIPAFRIRDLPAPFGTDVSPIEIVCAAWLRQHFAGGH